MIPQPICCTSPAPATVRYGCLKANDYAARERIELGSDADNVRIDAAASRILVGYGSGALAIIDPSTHSKVGDIPVEAHPEGFQIDPDTSQIFVNVPSARAIAVVDRVSQNKLEIGR